MHEVKALDGWLTFSFTGNTLVLQLHFGVAAALQCRCMNSLARQSSLSLNPCFDQLHTIHTLTNSTRFTPMKVVGASEDGKLFDSEDAQLVLDKGVPRCESSQGFTILGRSICSATSRCDCQIQ